MSRPAHRRSSIDQVRSTCINDQVVGGEDMRRGLGLRGASPTDDRYVARSSVRWLILMVTFPAICALFAACTLMPSRTSVYAPAPLGCTTGRTDFNQYPCSARHAGSPGLLDPSTQRVSIPDNSGDSGECQIDYANYYRKDFARVGPTYPSAVGLLAKTTSPRPPLGIGKTGTIVCEWAIEYDDFPLGQTPPMPSPNFRKAPRPGLYDLYLDAGRSVLDLRLDPEMVTDQLNQISGGAAAGLLYSYRIKDAKWHQTNSSTGLKIIPEDLQINFHVTIVLFGSQQFDCDAEVAFLLPGAPVEKLKVVSRFTNVSCDNSGLLSQMFGFSESLGDALRGQISDALWKASPAKPEDIADYIQGDPSTQLLLSDLRVQGLFCQDQLTNKTSLCVRLTWRYDRISRLISNLTAAAPQSMGPASLSGLDQLRTAIKLVAPRRTIPAGGGVITYPAKLTGTTYEDGDMALFGGLLCSSGESEGCRLVEKSQGPYGQFWRSPYLVERLQDHAFSGDQFQGVVSYFLTDEVYQDPASKERLRQYIKFIAKNTVDLPDKSTKRDVGYRSCTGDPAGDLNCVFDGLEWFWLNILAQKYGVQNEIPTAETAPQIRYGYSTAWLPFMALGSKLGYRTHLIAVQIYHLQLAGLEDTNTKTAAAILAARQPLNPFFLYLHLGADRAVTDVVNSKCSATLAAEADRWSWEVVETEEAWDRSMGWDCVFMINLVSK